MAEGDDKELKGQCVDVASRAHQYRERKILFGSRVTNVRERSARPTARRTAIGSGSQEKRCGKRSQEKKQNEKPGKRKQNQKRRKEEAEREARKEEAAAERDAQERKWQAEKQDYMGYDTHLVRTARTSNRTRK